MDQSRAGRFGAQLVVSLINFSVMAKYLPNFESVDETFDFNGCPPPFFWSMFRDEELLQFNEQMARLQNEIW